MLKVRIRIFSALALPMVAAALTACDIVTAEFRSQETAEWRRSYELQPDGRVEIANVNGKIDVAPSAGNTVEVGVLKVAKAGSPDAAKQALERIEILESASPSVVRLETKFPRSSSFFNMGGAEVRYTVKVPASADARFRTVNGGVEIVGLTGRVNAETTNGGIRAREIGGPIEASTTNGGVDVELVKVSESGARLSCTNGGIKLMLPSDARATISASITNGGIDTAGLSLEPTEITRRRLEARLNGGGPVIRIGGTNGGIRIASR
jgi:hypothetical protein